MPVFLGLLAAVWFMAGGFVLLDAFATLPRIANGINQVYIGNQIQLGVLLLSFGGMFAGLAHVCDCLNERRPKREPSTEPNDTRSWSQRYADDMVAARRGSMGLR